MTASELKAVNIPAFHITPLNIMLSPTSIAAAPVLSNPCLNSSNTSSAPNPSSSVLNFTLQHIGLIPAGVQVPANPPLQHVPVPSQPENVSQGSGNASLHEEKVSKSILWPLDCGGLSWKQFLYSRKTLFWSLWISTARKELAGKASISTM